MSVEPRECEQVLREVERVLGGAERVVLAVSGGRDSMVLLDAAARAAKGRIVAVATFDHGTGASASEAAGLVAGRAKALGMLVRRGKATGVPRSEAAWRAARWEFLWSVGRELGARVATAHTEDDQVETVIIRLLRGSGARGLAGLYAESAVLRPLLACTRRSVESYAEDRRIAFLDDPSNASRAHLRNRVRLDLRPAMERARPGISAELLAIARRAATLRAVLETHLSEVLEPEVAAGGVTVARDRLLHYDAKGLAMLWVAIAGRFGVALDRRGAERLVVLTQRGRAGAMIQLSGGFEALRHRERMVLRRVTAPLPERAVRLTADGGSLGPWRFSPSADAADPLWSAALPLDAPLTVRGWRPGDRMTPLGAETPRRVKGLLRDAGVDAARRAGWPVVLAGEEIVWIPGVRRSLAATARSGRPEVTFRCDAVDDR